MNIFELIDGRLYQWDINRRIKVLPQEGKKINEVHFAHEFEADALPVEVDAEGAAKIPDNLLQSDEALCVWAVAHTDDGRQTLYNAVFTIRRRAKPEDYVYTEDEIKSYEKLEKRIKALEENGGGGGAVESVNGKTGAVKLDAEDIGALSKNGGTLDGILKMPSGSGINGDTLAFYNEQGGTTIRMMRSSSGQVVFLQDDRSTGFSEFYRLPPLKTGLTTHQRYDILTTNDVASVRGSLAVYNTTEVDDKIEAVESDVERLSEEIENIKQNGGNGSGGTKEVSKAGEVVTVTPTAGTTAKVVSKITGMDAGFSQANKLILRQIKGKNLYNFAGLFGGAGKIVEKGGLTATINENGTVTITGTNTSGGWNNILDVKDTESFRWIFPAGTYTVPNSLVVSGKAADSAWTQVFSNKKGTFTVDKPFWISAAYITYASGAVVNDTIPLVMVSGTSIPSSGFAFDGEIHTAVFTNKIGDGEFNWQTGELKDADGNLVETIAPFEEFLVLDGANTFMTGVGVSTVTYKVPDDGSGDSGGAVEAFDPETWGMPVLYLNGDTTAMNKDNAVTLNYTFGLQEGTCTCKWQGSSSLSYMKKNYTLKFDTAFEAKEGWGEQKKYCAKANYIDHSHARNLVNAMLWGQIVKSRSTVPDVFANLVNGGAVDGFPVLIVMNGEFLGLYTFNIPKDGWMMGMGSGTNECILCAGNACPANGFKEAATLEGENDLEIEYITNEDDTAWAKTSVNNLINACINSDGSDLDTTIAPMLDWQSAIDYYIFTVLVDGHDMTLKNYLLVTFDGTKWFFSGYDMDCTYGLTWDGKAWLPAGNVPTFTSFANQHRVMELIKLYKKDALKARYAELRETVLSESNIATTFGNFIGQIPKPVYMQEAKKWPLIPNTSTNDIAQIRDYYRMRVAQADKWIEAL